MPARVDSEASGAAYSISSRAIDIAEQADARSEKAEALAHEAISAIKEHVIRCEGASTLLHRDVGDVRGDIAALRLLTLRIMWYGGIVLALVAAIQIMGLERTFDLFRFIRGK